MRALVRSAALIWALALLLPDGAESLTFGANLDARTPTSNTSCAYPPNWPFFPTPAAESCTWFSSGSLLGSAETDVVPLPDPAIFGNQSGTITEVRIKTGPGPPGPAKLTILRAVRSQSSGEAACCIGQAETAQFTLNPSSLVHVQTNLPVAAIYDPKSRYYSYDILALSVLNNTTFIPAEYNGLDANGYCSGGWGPYIKGGEERYTGEYGVCGYLILMQADLTIGAAAGPAGPPAPGAGGAAPKLGLVGAPKTLPNGNVLLELEAPGAGKLGVNATAGLPEGLVARVSRKVKATVGRKSKNVTKAGPVRIVLAPNRLGKKVVARRGKLKAMAKVTYTPTSGKRQQVTHSVTFR